ncbi:aspartate/glutamate racemase family protein [Ferrimonas sediminicola]|uniref:Aspartate/glutamate racemase family protein n=1 Tax=Ferrimonas sediminicola TaxID=2569538 RepID=A0A4U1BFS8_9GAMM|nr:aspartate/glutamate racemase family protein [Ferrimonas sediminicola]TKB48871.1 aspartate/glutamate racemase family protein [Ferrimonas sediminicola]
MKTIGIIGGMSWESSVSYYRQINRGIAAALGGLHSAKLVLYSVDFAEIEALQSDGDWQRAGTMLADAARALEGAGAELVLIATNTMQKVASQVSEAIGVPLLHIADATAARLSVAGIDRIGLLGTRFTMEQAFYRERLQTRGIEVLVPDDPGRALVDRVIYRELCLGRVEPASREAYLEIIDELASRGAQGVILGCTEIGLLVTQSDTRVPLFDTTRIHADAAVEKALES